MAQHITKHTTLCCQKNFFRNREDPFNSGFHCISCRPAATISEILLFQQNGCYEPIFFLIFQEFGQIFEHTHVPQVFRTGSGTKATEKCALIVHKETEFQSNLCFRFSPYLKQRHLDRKAAVVSSYNLFLECKTKNTVGKRQKICFCAKNGENEQEQGCPVVTFRLIEKKKKGL